MRVLVLVAAIGGCTTDAPALDHDSAPAPIEDAGAVVVSDAALAVPVAEPAAAPKPWTFAVLSDLHLPNPREADVTRVIASLIELHVRLVVITGDHTNGNPTDHRRSFRGEGWDEVTRALAPLHDAGIPILPVAGNHDTYLPWQRDEYAEAFADLHRWAAPLTITPQSPEARGHGRAPFSYSVDVDGVHLSLAHLVTQSVEPDVAHWLTGDLAAAAGATHRIVFGHVPMSSVIGRPHPLYLSELGTILERGKATLHVAGHEHLVWDEDVSLPDGGSIREVLVGCSSGFYVFAPTERSKELAHCSPIVDPTRRSPMLCRMPHGGGAFELSRRRKNRFVQHARVAFALITVDGASIDVKPMTLDTAGHAAPFYLDR